MDCPAKLYSLTILAALKMYSDQQHPLTSEAICQKLLHDPSITCHITPKTVRTQLQDLYELFLSSRDYFEQAYGGSLHCLVKTADRTLKDVEKYTEETNAWENSQKSRYYYWEPSVSKEEWTLFQNMILCNQYLTVEQTKDLYDLTERMKNPENPLHYVSERNRLYKQKDIDIFKTLSLLQTQIRKNQRVIMQYGEYRTGTTLSPRGKERLINPYAVLSTNGYLYLIATPANQPERIINFRVDRILSLSIPNENEQKRETIPLPLRKYFPNADKSFMDAPLYRNEHPVMYSGEVAHIQLLCHPSILNNVIDDFGFNLRIETKHNYTPSDWVLIKMHASLMGTKVFCVHHCSHCLILSPTQLRVSVLENLREGLCLNEFSEFT